MAIYLLLPLRPCESRARRVAPILELHGGSMHFFYYSSESYYPSGGSFVPDEPGLDSVLEGNKAEVQAWCVTAKAGDHRWFSYSHFADVLVIAVSAPVEDR